MREVQVHLLAAGACWHAEAMTLRGAAWTPVEYPALPALLIHPVEGPILFDTGYAQAFTDATQPFPERFYRWLTPVRLPTGWDAASQCRALGVLPAEVRHVVLSHFHADHVAGLTDFPAARIHCARGGLDLATAGGRWRNITRGVLRTLLPADIAARSQFFEEAPRRTLPRDVRPFAEGADLLGDGSLLAVELPGHCPGHWGLLAADARCGLHFLVADAAWSLAAIHDNVPPPALTTALLGDTRTGRQTLAALHALHLRNPELVITPYHCRERAAAVTQERQR
jgi:glyoxylase-like metal-dependent hydrolase (beta-lactamase superfamily II)